MTRAARLVSTLLVLATGVAAVTLAARVNDEPLRLALVTGAALAILIGAVRAWSPPVPAQAPIVQRAESLEMISGLSRDRRRTIVDRETGLCADWYFRLRLEEEIARAERFGQRFVVATVREPSLPQVEAASVIRKLLRHIDYGADLGEYLAVVLPNTDIAGANVWRERFESFVKAEVRTSEYPQDGGTVSALLGEQQWDTRPPDSQAA